MGGNHRLRWLGGGGWQVKFFSTNWVKHFYHAGFVAVELNITQTSSVDLSSVESSSAGAHVPRLHRSVRSFSYAACDPPSPKESKSITAIFKKHERITELGHIEMAVLRNSGSLSLQRLTSPRRLGEAVTGTRSALFLLHLSNLRKPRVRKHKVFSKLVNRPLKHSQRSQQPSDKVPSHYHSIDSRDFAYLTGNFTLLF